jgi:hypothetical protein
MAFIVNNLNVKNLAVNGKIITNGLVLALNAADRNSYPGSGTTWNDLSGNQFNSTLTNSPTYSSNNGGLIVLDGTNDFISIPGNTTIYSSDFTWQSFHYIRQGNGSDLDAMWWSEAGTKNFLTGYRNTNIVNSYFRIDTSATVYQSPSIGIQSNGLGSNAPVSKRWLLTTMVKSGTTFYLYWNDAVLMWTVTISNWIISSPSQAIAFGAKEGGTFPTAMDVGSLLMYNRALSTSEITQNYNAQRSRFNL